MRNAGPVPHRLSERETQPFPTAEEAWLWFSACQLARIEGVRFVAGRGQVARPCEPDDIYRAADRLIRRGVLGARHVAVLGRFGRRLAPPDPWAGDSAHEAHLWQQAMEHLARELGVRGIVAGAGVAIDDCKFSRGAGTVS